jgi:hypothetical protein
LLNPVPERVEHVEEDEAGEGHGDVARGHLAVFESLVEDQEGTRDNDAKGKEFAKF